MILTRFGDKFSFLTGILCGLLFCTPSASELTDIAGTLEIISQKIDSLDLLKQSLKRNGRTITEIDRQQELLRDSLHNLRNKIQTVSRNLPISTEKKRTPFFFFKPSNLFDWIIVVTGLIASFSGLMLIIGISRMLGMKRKLKPRNPPVENRKTSQPACQKNGNVPSAFTQYTADSSAPAPSPPEIDTGTINQIRQRMELQNSGTDTPADTPPFLPPIPSTDTALASLEDDTVESKVLAAYQQGLDVVAISRKLHISADHVALILKMGGKKASSG